MLPLRQITPLCLLVLCGTAVAGALPTHLLDAGPGSVRTIRAADLTGDDHADVVAFTDGAEGIAIAIFVADRSGGFQDKKPTVVVRPKEMGCTAVYYAFLATLRRGEPKTLVLVDREKGVVGVTVVFADGKWKLHGPEKIADAPVLPFFPDDRRIAVLDAAADLDGDGADELILPTATGHLVRSPGAAVKEGESAPVRIIDTGTSHRLTAGAHRFFSLHWEIPRLQIADFDADGKKDLITTRGSEFLLFLRRKDGSFFDQRRRVDLLENPAWADVNSTFLLADVDGDQKADLLMTQTPTSVKVMGDFQSKHVLFRNPPIFHKNIDGRLTTPTSIVQTGGTSINPKLLDFDGDGDLDLLVCSLEIDLGSQIRKDVSAKYSLFLFDGEKNQFESSSHFGVSRPYPWDRLTRGSTRRVCFFEGDFNGDGLLDLVDIADEGHLTILTGERPEGLWSSSYAFTDEEDGKALFRAKAEVKSDLIIDDLDGDGTSDLVAYRDSKIYVVRGVKRGAK